MTIVEELRQFGESHNRNGERRTADLLFRAADYILAIEDEAAEKRATTAGRNIISRQAWNALLAEQKLLEGRVARFTLRTQRAARLKAEEALFENNRKIRAVDGVIGIDA